MAAARIDQSERVLRAVGTTTAVAAWRDVWAARDVVRAFAVRSLRVRYRQAALGAVWALAQPLMLLVPFAIFLNGPTGHDDGVPFRASTLTALVGWQYLSGAVTTGSGSLVNESMLVRKTWFPREAPVIASVAAALVELCIGLALALVVGPLLGAHLGLSLLTLPLLAATLAVVALSISLPLAAINAVFRDVRHALPFAVLMWLFVSPVAYPVERVNSHWRLLYAVLNPAVGPLDGLRRVLAHGTWPDPALLGASLGASLAIAAVGHRIFRRLAPTLADMI